MSTEQLELHFDWLESEPDVSERRWFKRFPELTMCADGEWINGSSKLEREHLQYPLANQPPPFFAH